MNSCSGPSERRATRTQQLQAEKRSTPTHVQSAGFLSGSLVKSFNSYARRNTLVHLSLYPGTYEYSQMSGLWTRRDH